MANVAVAAQLLLPKLQSAAHGRLTTRGEAVDDVLRRGEQLQVGWNRRQRRAHLSRVREGDQAEPVAGLPLLDVHPCVRYWLGFAGAPELAKLFLVGARMPKRGLSGCLAAGLKLLVSPPPKSNTPLPFTSSQPSGAPSPSLSQFSSLRKPLPVMSGVR